MVAATTTTRPISQGRALEDTVCLFDTVSGALLFSRQARFHRPGITRLRDLRNLLIEIRRRDDAVVEVAQIEPLVRCMRVFVWQPNTEQHARQPEFLLEG